jgi:hypothetical protein
MPKQETDILETKGAKSRVAISKVNKFFTTKNTKFAQRAQYVDNQSCHFAFSAVSL